MNIEISDVERDDINRALNHRANELRYALNNVSYYEKLGQRWRDEIERINNLLQGKFLSSLYTNHAVIVSGDHAKSLGNDLPNDGQWDDIRQA